VSHLKPGDLIGTKSSQVVPRWLHTAESSARFRYDAASALEAMQAARKHGTIVSYDLTIARRSGKRSAQEASEEVNRKIAPFVDVVIGNEEDFSAAPD